MGNLWNVGNLTYRSLAINGSGTFSVRQIIGTCTTAASVPVTVTRLTTCTGAQARVDEGTTVEELTSTQSFSISLYPNPVSGNSFTVQSDSELTHIRILTVTGVVVYSQELSGYSAEVKAHLPTGAYLAEITSPTGTVRKLIHWQ
jgi:hypothetical protein